MSCVPNAILHTMSYEPNRRWQMMSNTCIVMQLAVVEYSEFFKHSINTIWANLKDISKSVISVWQPCSFSAMEATHVLFVWSFQCKDFSLFTLALHSTKCTIIVHQYAILESFRVDIMYACLDSFRNTVRANTQEHNIVT